MSLERCGEDWMCGAVGRAMVRCSCSEFGNLSRHIVSFKESREYIQYIAMRRIGPRGWLLKVHEAEMRERSQSTKFR